MSYHRILAAFDGSELAEKALRHAVDLAERRPGTYLTVVHVRQRPLVFGVSGYGFIQPEGFEQEIAAHEATLLARIQQHTDSLPYTEVSVLTGIPAPAILAHAAERNCDLIVMGSRGLTTIREIMLGSVSHHVVQRATVPVLVVK
ncbi:universal stress protein [Cohnella sp. REN36]|uniref:universal stress protein n=1 Tax=Cohnella sp. REN36 TaxID=2887347 RepID=UPI001D139E1E|nr:universal stress protein [Cohnella sp. REN36]MCC3375959.1 universal stress protein [Cohnella sp. REN36]